MTGMSAKAKKDRAARKGLKTHHYYPKSYRTKNSKGKPVTRYHIMSGKGKNAFIVMHNTFASKKAASKYLSDRRLGK